MKNLFDLHSSICYITFVEKHPEIVNKSWICILHRDHSIQRFLEGIRSEVPLSRNPGEELK